MTRKTFARWICNVCGAVEETDADKQPEAWVGYGYTQPGVPAGEQRSIGHLCPDCATKVARATSVPSGAES